MYKLSLGLILGMVSGTALAADVPDFKEGQWNVQYTMEVTGMPFKMPPISGSRSVCLTKKNFVPDNSQAGQKCETLDVKVNGNTVDWTMKCTTPQGSIEGQGKVTYKADSYDGSMDAKLVSASSSMAMNYRYTMNGQREGACAK